GSHRGEPACLSEGDVVLLHEPEDVGVEPQRLLLVVDQHRGDVDPHLLLPLWVGRHRFRMVSSGVVSRSWNLYLPSLLVLTSPADSRTSRCWEMACRDEPSPGRGGSRLQISNRVCPSRSLSSSRIALLVGSASALYTSLTMAV